MKHNKVRHSDVLQFIMVANVRNNEIPVKQRMNTHSVIWVGGTRWKTKGVVMLGLNLRTHHILLRSVTTERQSPQACSPLTQSRQSRWPGRGETIVVSWVGSHRVILPLLSMIRERSWGFVISYCHSLPAPRTSAQFNSSQNHSAGQNIVRLDRWGVTSSGS